MKMTILLPALLMTCGVLLDPAGAQQAGPSAAEAKLKESLKATMTQLRTMQGERDTAVAEKQALDVELKKLKADLEVRKKDEEVAKQKAQKEIEDLTVKNAETQKSLDAHKASLQQWMEGFRKMEGMRDTTESKRASLASRVVEMQRRIDDQQAKNREMYKLATEILQRYEDYGLGKALLSKEPFTGLAKVKLQTFVQDFGDKLADQQIFPESKPGGAARPSDPKSQAAKPAEIPAAANSPAKPAAAKR